MTEPTTPPSAPKGEIQDGLASVRTVAQRVAGDALKVVAQVDRAEKVLDWAINSGSVRLPEVLKTEALAAKSDLEAATARVDSALSRVQLITSGSTTAGISSHLVSLGFSDIALPVDGLAQTQARLNSRLRALPGAAGLADRRAEAWTAYYRGTEEAAAQACHSMREVLTALLDRYCANDLVMKAPWWSADPNTRDGVSKRHKVKYFVLCNGGNGLADEILDELTTQVNRALEFHQAAIRVAHHSTGGNQSATRSILADLEEVMLTLLDRRHSLASCS